MSYRAPYGSQPPGHFGQPGSGTRPGANMNPMQQQQQQQQAYGMGVNVPMHQTGFQMYQGSVQQQGGVYQPNPGYGQVAGGMQQQQQQYMMQGGMVPRGQAGVPQQGMVQGMVPGLQVHQQNMTPEQHKKFLAKQKKMLEEQKKKEEQERKERYREEQKRKLKEFSTGGRAAMGSKSIDMGDLMSKSLMTSSGASKAQHPGMQYHSGMQMPTPGFAPQGPHMGVTPMQGGAMVAMQQMHPQAGATPPVTHTQSMDDGFSDFMQAGPAKTAPANPPGPAGGSTDDFGDFLQAPSKSRMDPLSAVTPPQPAQLQSQPEPPSQPTPPAPSQPPPQGEDDGFGDFLGGPSASQCAEVTSDETQPSDEPSLENTESVAQSSKPGHSLESMMMQSTDLSESQKQRRRFNQKPSLNEVKGHGSTTTKTSTSGQQKAFAASNKARSWNQPNEDLSALFTLPEAEAQPGQPGVVPGTALGVQGQETLPSVPGKQQVGASAIQIPAWLKNNSTLPTVYFHVLEASTREGAIQTELLYPILVLSGLDRHVLGQIWSTVNQTTPGQLVPHELYMALALIAQAQKGQEVSMPSLCSLSEAPIPHLYPPSSQAQPGPIQQPHQPPSSVEAAGPMATSSTGGPPLSTASAGGAFPSMTSSSAGGVPLPLHGAAPHDDDEDFAPFQEAPKPAVASDVQSALANFASSIGNSQQAGNTMTGAISSSLDIPIPSSGLSSKQSSSPDHTPTEGDEDESFDDFKSAPASENIKAEKSAQNVPVIPVLPGPGSKAFASMSQSSSPAVGQASSASPATGIPALVPPKASSAGLGSFSAVAPPLHGIKGGVGAVRTFSSEEQLKGEPDDFGDFEEFKTVGSAYQHRHHQTGDAGSIKKKTLDDWGSFASGSSQSFKHSASESNLQGMKGNETEDRYAALRGIGGSLFDSEPVTLDRIPSNDDGGFGGEDDFADFQTAGPAPVPPSSEMGKTGMHANQGGLFDSVGTNKGNMFDANQIEGSLFDSKSTDKQSGLFDPASSGLKQPDAGFAAFSPPRESSDWAAAAKQDQPAPKVSHHHDESFEGFFSARTTTDPIQGSTAKKEADSASKGEPSEDRFASLAGLHEYITDKSDPEDSSFFGDFQTGSDAKQPTQTVTPSISIPIPSKSSSSQNSGVTLFRLTPPPMTSSPPGSDDGEADDQYSALRDLSAVDPFEQMGHGVDDGMGTDFYDTQFDPIDPAPTTKAPEKPDLALDDSSQPKQHKLELTLDTPSTASSKPFALGSISDLDLKNYDLNLSVGSTISKAGTNDSKERAESFGDFASAQASEPVPASKVDSVALMPATSSHHLPPPLPVGDRYSEVAGDSSEEGRHASQWEKCLIKCYEVMSKANSVFNNISSSSVCSEVISSSGGIDYLTGVIEVYRVACRITTSMKGLGIDNDDLGKLEKDINRVWHNLSAFLQLSTIKPKEGSFVFKTAMLRPEPSNTSQACGVCLLNVDSRSKAFDRVEDNNKLSYGGRQYHTTCANLWVNMVDSILPALPLNTLL